jgi:hypothetical protein
MVNDGSPRCGHGSKAVVRKRPDLGPGWVQEIAEDCRLCQADPGSVRIPYQPGNWQEIEAREAAQAAGEGT